MVALALDWGRECFPGHPEEEPEGKVPPQSEGWGLTQLLGSFPHWSCTQLVSSICMVQGPVDTVDWERHVHRYFRTVDRSGLGETGQDWKVEARQEPVSSGLSPDRAMPGGPWMSKTRRLVSTY